MAKCPMCGTRGEEWKENGVFRCPNCSSIYSRFAVLAESGRPGMEAVS